MYLIERIFGIFCFYIILLITVIGISKYGKRKKFLILYILIISFMAYSFVPNKGADLTRHYDVMNYYADMNTEEISVNLQHSSTPIAILYLTIIAKIGNNNLLPAITAIIYYGIIFFAYYMFSKKYQIDNKSFATGLLLFMISGKYIGVISGIRSGLAFSIVFLCFYRETFLNKNIYHNILLYIIAMCIHNSMLVFILIRILYYFVFEKQHKSQKTMTLFTITILGLILINNFNYIFYSTYEKGIDYLSNKMYSYIWENIISWAYILFTLVTIIKFRKIFKSEKKINNITRFIVLLCIFAIIFSFEHSIFSRTQGYISIIFLIPFSYLLNYFHQNNIDERKYNKIVLVFAMIIILIACTRGNISSLKFFIT